MKRREFFRLVVCAGLLLPGVLDAQWQVVRSRGESNVWALASNKHALFAGTLNGVFVSRDQGDHWTEANSGLSNLSISALGVHDKLVFAGALNNEKGLSESVFRSADDGKNWTPSDNGIPHHTTVLALAATGRTLLAGGGSAGKSAIFRSVDDGASWRQVFAGPTNSRVNAFAVLGTDIFAATSQGLYRSSDGGQTWEESDRGLDTAKGTDAQLPNVSSVVAGGAVLIAGLREGGLFVSMNRGRTWTQTKSAPPASTRVPSLTANGTTIILGAEGGVYFTRNGGKRWTATNEGLSSTKISHVAIAGDYVVAASGVSILRRAFKEMTGGGK